jgi:hypothetical protein
VLESFFAMVIFMRPVFMAKARKPELRSVHLALERFSKIRIG